METRNPARAENSNPFQLLLYSRHIIIVTYTFVRKIFAVFNCSTIRKIRTVQKFQIDVYMHKLIVHFCSIHFSTSLPTSSPALPSDIVSIGAGVAVSIILVAIIIFFFMLCGFIYSRRRWVAQHATKTLVTNVRRKIPKSTEVTKAQNTAYPMKSRDQKNPCSNQALLNCKTKT